ncbi:hypothetical protein O181_056911 [Austropuccinia psidii MF-1]|uniref:Uncharacterized protein n=1 Tax=Austropuccinia psidii MF-1 TaxID=1389203 RepID=A0A9Q3HTF5_9BASI|nr:hypothetical protein [Austropuccinia psidii MF-1]
MRLRNCPPISALTTPYASTPPPHILLGLQSLRYCGSLKLCLRRHPHPHLCLLAPSQHASNVAYHPYTPSALPTCLRRCLPSLCLQCPSNMPPMPLTILTLAVLSRHASNADYHPYARSSLPTCLRCCLPSLCSQFPPDIPPMLLTILTLEVPSRHPPHTGLILKAAYDPYAPEAP